MGESQGSQSRVQVLPAHTCGQKTSCGAGIEVEANGRSHREGDVSRLGVSNVSLARVVELAAQGTRATRQGVARAPRPRSRGAGGIRNRSLRRALRRATGPW